MADQPSDKKKPAAERSRQVGVSFPVDRMIEDQLEEERRQKARGMERSRSEVYGMPVDTIIESANAAYPPIEAKPKAKPPEPVWTSIEDQMANPMGRKSRPLKGKPTR
jgi:hypothetical protein